MADTTQHFDNGSGPVIADDGSSTHMLPATDDGSAGPVELGFPINFFGKVFTSLYVNANGNVTFGEPLYQYLPFRMTARTPPIIAPFLADVDTRSGVTGRVRYGPTTFEGRPALGVNWLEVGYHFQRTDKLNRFQLLLVDRSNEGFGDFDIVMNYDRVVWESGRTAGGTNGLGGLAAGAGFSAGTGDSTFSFEFPGALSNGALLDHNTETGLSKTRRNSPVWGRHIFRMRQGRIDTTLRVRPQGLILPQAVTLKNGQVLALGEFNPFADVFDPVTRMWSPTRQNTEFSHRYHTATLLPDGKVLVVGGEDMPRSTERYYPDFGSWMTVGSLKDNRIRHTATLVTRDRMPLVLVVGGQDDRGARQASAELYDPSSGTWTSAASMKTARTGHTATLVTKNRKMYVLVAGGHVNDPNSSEPIYPAELYDIAANDWLPADRMLLTRQGHTATLLSDGKVLVAGGEPLSHFDGNPFPPGHAELYDPERDSWTSAGTMSLPRRNHAAVLLSGGQVLVMGGYHEVAGIQDGVEVYTPGQNDWYSVASMQAKREYHAAVRLADDRVLIIGGVTNPDKLQGTYELYRALIIRG